MPLHRLREAGMHVRQQPRKREAFESILAALNRVAGARGYAPSIGARTLRSQAMVNGPTSTASRQLG